MKQLGQVAPTHTMEEGNLPHPQAPTSIHSTLPQVLKSTHKQYCATHKHPQAPTILCQKHPQALKSTHKQLQYCATHNHSEHPQYHTTPRQTISMPYNFRLYGTQKAIYSYHTIPQNTKIPNSIYCLIVLLEIVNCNAGNHLRIWESFLTTMVVGPLWSSSLPARYTRPHQPLVVKFLALFPRCL